MMKQLEKVRILKHGEELEQVKGPGSTGKQARAGFPRNGENSSGTGHAEGGGHYREEEGIRPLTSPFGGADGPQKSQLLAASPLSAFKSETASHHCNSIIHREPQPHKFAAPRLSNITQDSLVPALPQSFIEVQTINPT